MRAPRAIETARARHFPAAMARFAGGTAAPTRDDIGDAYQVAKDPRWQQQREKCAYCDRHYPPSHEPTEHFRPVLGGYWWLAWDWDNLLFACPSCNGSKSNSFDLLPGSVRLQAGERPPRQERPKLINPLEEDPLAVVAFVKGPHGWVPTGIDADGRGAAMITATGLLQHFNVHQDHVAGITIDIARVVALVNAADAARAPGPTLEITGEFQTFIQRNYNDRSILRSLTWAVWNDFFPASVRQHRALELPPPRTPPLPVPPERARELALLDSVTPQTRECIYALGGRAREAAWDLALTSLLDERAFTLDDLSVLTGGGAATVVSHLKRLENAGRVTLSGRGATRAAARR